MWLENAYIFQPGETSFSLARILVRKERLEDAKRVLGRIYAYATPEQVDLKVTDRSSWEGTLRS